MPVGQRDWTEVSISIVSVLSKPKSGIRKYTHTEWDTLVELDLREGLGVPSLCGDRVAYPYVAPRSCFSIYLISICRSGDVRA